MKNDTQQDLLDSIAKDPYVAMRFARRMRSQGKSVPDIILKSIVSEPVAGSNFALELAMGDYILVGQSVPELLLNKIVTNPKNSYYIAKYYKKHNPQIPDRVLKSIQKSPFAGLSFDEDEEQSNEPIIKKQLLQKILNDPKYSLRYVKVLAQNERPIPASVEDSFAQFPVAATEYATIVVSNDGKVSQKILDIIKKDKDQSFNFANGILDAAQKVAPLEIINSLARDSSLAASYGIKFIKIHEKDKKILDILENGIVKGKISTYKSVDVERSENASKYVMAYVNSTGELPGKAVLQLTNPSSLVIVSNMLLSQNKQIPQEIIDTIAKNGTASYAFTARYKMIKGGKTLPSIYKKIQDSADKYDKERI